MMTTFVEGETSLIRRVASMPDIPPLKTMSISTTSGRYSVLSLMAVSGSWTAGATICKVSSSPTTIVSASVRILWSSQISNVTRPSAVDTLIPLGRESHPQDGTPLGRLLRGYLS